MGDSLIVSSRFSQAFDDEVRSLQSPGIVFERVRPSMECHLEAIALEMTVKWTMAQIGVSNNKRGIGIVGRKGAGIVEWMRDRDAEPAAGFEDAGALSDGAWHIGYIHEAVVGDDQVEVAVGEWQGSGVGQFIAAFRVGFFRVSKQRWRAVNRNNVVASLRQIACDPPLATTNLEGLPPGRRHDLVEE